MNEELEQEVRELIVATLLLEGVRPDQIGADTPLFRDGLGLDSVDALELAVAVERRYHVKVAANDVRNRELFASVRSLAAHIAAHRQASRGEVT
jgi:acyl carrier protein